MPPRINGGFHLVLVVKDRKLSAQWYGRVFGFEVVRDVVEAVLTDVTGQEFSFICTSLFHFPTRMFIGLAEPRDHVVGGFNWHSAGLQHFGFHIEERSELDDWILHLDSLGIAHSPLIQEGPGLLVRFCDPDQIPVEVFWADVKQAEGLLKTLARARIATARERRP